MGSATRKIANAFSTSGIISSANINNASLDNITSIAGAGDMVFVSSATASASASIEFSLGSYKEYKFYFVNIHPSGNSAHFNFNLSIDSGSNYNVTKTSTFFYASNGESGANIGASLSYWSTGHLAQSTSDQNIARNQNADNDSMIAGTLSLFNPSSTTYVKHFISRALGIYHEGTVNGPFDYYSAGYANTTSALTNIRFSMSSGNIDAGKILMFGVN